MVEESSQISKKEVPSRFINQILLGDCIKIMKRIPDNSIDMTFCDPPYNLKKSYEYYEDDKETHEYLSWCRKWLHEMVRVTKPTGSIFTIYNLIVI